MSAAVACTAFSQSVPALPVADEIGERCQGSSAFAGAKGGNQERSIALVEVCCCPLLIATQDACDEGRVQDFPPLDSVILLLVYRAQTDSSL